MVGYCAILSEISSMALEMFEPRKFNLDLGGARKSKQKGREKLTSQKKKLEIGLAAAWETIARLN